MPRSSRLLGSSIWIVGAADILSSVALADPVGSLAPRYGSSEWPDILSSVTLLSEPEIEGRLAGSGWQRDGQAIVREWRLDDFAQAIAFVNRVANVAETANHHPDIHLHGWNKVRLELSTHSEGGLTQADFDMASRIDALA